MYTHSPRYVTRARIISVRALVLNDPSTREDINDVRVYVNTVTGVPTLEHPSEQAFRTMVLVAQAEREQRDARRVSAASSAGRLSEGHLVGTSNYASGLAFPDSDGLGGGSDSGGFGWIPSIPAGEVLAF